MPDTMSLSTSVSLGLLAGIVSGVCYMVANGISWPGSGSRKKLCVTSSNNRGICSSCGGDKLGGDLPCVCYVKEPVKFEKGAWFLRQVQRTLSLMPWSLSTDKLEQIGARSARSILFPNEEYEGDTETRSTRDLRHVREFLETLSAKLAGGPLDGTTVAPLYEHHAYIPSRGAPSSPTPNASSAHAQLKKLVARVVEEAASLPALAQYARDPPRAPSVENSTYEDLLATAILNKVIERYQNESGSGGRSSGIHSASASPTPSERSTPRSQRIRDNTPPLQEEDEVSDWDGSGVEEALEIPKRVPFPEFGGNIVHANENDDRDFDEVSDSDIQAVDGSWEENWLFQRKKIKAVQSVPVPMLVPNSNAEYRALIGDRDADDTTDLSDNASETEEEEEVQYKSDIKRVLDFQHVIGGKPKVDDILDFEPDSLTIIDDIREFNNNDKTVIDATNEEIDDKNIDKVDTVNENVKKTSVLYIGAETGPLPKAEFAVKEEIHRTLTNGLREDLGQNEETGKDEIDGYQKFTDYRHNTRNGHEREGEYEETTTLPVQRYADSLRRKHFDETPQPHSISSNNIAVDEDLIPGSIADRERKKWLNYVEMPNNPYSPEAIQRRLSAKSTSSLFDSFTKSSEPTVVTHYEKHNSKSMENLKGKSPTPLTVSQSALNDDRSDSEPSKITKDVIGGEGPQYKRYGRDYYIKEAKISSGARKRSAMSDTSSMSSMNKSISLDNFDTEFASTGLLIQQFNTIATNQDYKKFARKNSKEQITITCNNNNNNEVLIAYDNADEQTLFSATPAIVEEDTENKFNEILQTSYETDSMTIDIDAKSETASENSPNNTSIVSNSSLDDSIIKIYNVQTGEIVKCKPDNVSQRYEADTTISDADNIAKSRDDEYDSVPVIVEEISGENQLETIDESSEIQLPKVKELAKKFVSMESLDGVGEVPTPSITAKRKKSIENILNTLNERPNHKQAYMHSLTARSISKQFREELKLSMATPIKTPGGTNELPKGIEEVVKESSRPGSPLPEPGTIKTKLAFFESLKSKFSR